MKRLNSIAFLLFVIFIVPLTHDAYSQEKKTDRQPDSAMILKLLEIPEVVEVEDLQTTPYFVGKYKLTYRQPLDHDNPDAGYFEQRVFLNHKDFDKPMVVITEGYAAGYAAHPMYQSELTGIVDGNQVCIEHRYFSNSTPEPVDWKYLTVEEAATDQHKVIQSLKKLYDKKWISTGISKGGQTVFYLQTYYPEDVDIAIPYVAPLNFGVEDGRHEPFIEKNGNRKERKAVRNFQNRVLQNRDRIFPMFKKYVENQGMEFYIPMEEVYDYCVLEYSFAFWQWVANTDQIPGAEATDEELLNHLLAVSGPDYFDIKAGERLLPFFVQAARELGYYGYDTEPFKEWLVIPDAKGYLHEVFLPDSLANIEFIPETNQKVIEFYEKNDPKMIMIYGELDPWSAPGLSVRGKKNIMKVVKKGGHHGTRISNLPEKQKEKVIEQIKAWLEE